MSESTARTMHPMIGLTGQLRVGDMIVSVMILDVRERYGRTDYLVTPRSGDGQQWKSAESITVEEN
jgi:hypothetical protein